MLQLPLNVRLDDSASFNNFFEGENSQLLFRLQQAALNRGEFLYIWGGQQSGKTHLAQAICNLANRNKRSVVYLPMSDPNFSPEILDGMSCLDLVCLDDLEAIADSNKWQQKLFELYNNLKQENKSLVIFSNAPPKQLSLSLADLLSRLTNMEVYRLLILNDQQKLEFFRQRAANRGIEISLDVAQFLLARQSRSIVDLVQMLEQIDQSSIALKRKVTIPLLKQIFNL